MKIFKCYLVKHYSWELDAFACGDYYFFCNKCEFLLFTDRSFGLFLKVIRVEVKSQSHLTDLKFFSRPQKNWRNSTMAFSPKMNQYDYNH